MTFASFQFVIRVVVKPKIDECLFDQTKALILYSFTGLYNCTDSGRRVGREEFIEIKNFPDLSAIVQNEHA